VVLSLASMAENTRMKEMQAKIRMNVVHRLAMTVKKLKKIMEDKVQV